ncbi:MAG TPA: hypothetical protein VHV30_06875, partial [Polyangiaceae bacterium]|nr:hypothetical protein [Polyangiaceae bacterium]
LDGAQNIAYRLALNTLVEGAYVMGDAAKEWFVEEIRASEYRMPIALAVKAGDADAAEAITRKIMRAAAETFERIVPPPPPASAPKRSGIASIKRKSRA